MTVKRRILVDTREQKPWKFTRTDWKFGTNRICLKTGDYTLEGLEDIFTIDRKGKVTEITGNLLSQRFERELQRMEDFKHAYVICEFPYEDLERYPHIDSVPMFLRHKIKAKGPFLIKILERLQNQYKAEWIFGPEGTGKKFAIDIFYKMNELYGS